MAGRPQSRARRERLDAALDRIGAARDSGDPAELRRALTAGLTEFERPARERRLRRGLAKPRTVAESDIWASDVLPGPDGEAGQ